VTPDEKTHVLHVDDEDSGANYGLDSALHGRTGEDEGCLAQDSVSRSAHPNYPPPGPRPLPKRPNGRLFVGAVLMGVVGYVAFQAWDSFLRYEAHGVVQGRQVDVHPPWDGVIQYAHVTEGQRVVQDQPLVTLDNLELRQSIDDLLGQQKVVHAEIKARIAEVKRLAAAHRVPRQEASAEYFELWAQLVNEQAKLAELNAERLRISDLHKQGAATSSDFDKATFAWQGQLEKVDKLRDALVEAKKRVDFSHELTVPQDDQIQPLLARLDLLLAQEDRLRQKLALGVVRAPINGVVVSRQRFIGQFSPVSQPVLTLLEDASLEVVVYLRQKCVARYQVGDVLRIVADPDETVFPCQVVRLGDRYVEAPLCIATRYRTDENLLPIYLRPLEGLHPHHRLKLGATVKLLPH
jgi:HlyD family secretion protein